MNDILLVRDIADRLLKRKLSREMDQRARDEVVFWFTVLEQPTKLKSAIKTLFRNDETLSRFLSREVQTEKDKIFVRKNAFRLLSLHRYILAAAAFLRLHIQKIENKTKRQNLQKRNLKKADLYRNWLKFDHRVWFFVFIDFRFSFFDFV